MPKRRHVSEDEDETHVSYKRARTTETDDGSEDEVPQRHVHGRDRNEKRKRGTGVATSGSDLSDVERDIDSPRHAEIDAVEFERVNGERLYAQLERQRQLNIQGGIAECGIIEYIEMHQFMCHKYLKFTFGPQINFIIGHNGSGKSAVLSAITVALGGNTKSTGRGTGLKSFIREGQGASEVTLHIKNQGEEPFRHEVYGNTVVITRKFTKEGSSSWKIKSADGRVISTKKDELSAICDHMNIQVDNPMTILTQDSARQFLSASAPRDKYKFFLRGTQLSQLEEEYTACSKNVNLTARVLASKKDAIPDLEDRVRETEARYAEASKARQQRKKADDLKKELAWSHVAFKKNEMEEAIQHTAKLTRRLVKIEESVQSSEAEFDKATALVLELEAEFQNLEKFDDLGTRKAEIATQMRANKVKLLDYATELEDMDTSIQNLDGRVKEFENRIEEEARRGDYEAKRMETQRKLEDAREDVTRLEGRIGDLMTERQNLSVQADRLKEDGESKIPRRETIQKDITRCDAMIDSAKRAENDALAPYGNNMKQLLDRINSMHWVGDIPLGPLGQYVKAKDPKVWGKLLRNRLSQLLVAFAVTDARDHSQLKKLLMDTKNPRTSIIIYQKDMFDFQHGEPPDHLHTAMRELEISDPYVLRILINQAHIENQILAHTRKEGEATLHSIHGGNAWSLDLFNVHVFPEGGCNSSPLSTYPLPGAMNLMLTERDTTAEIGDISERKKELENDYQQINQNMETTRSQYMQLRQQIDKLNDQEKYLENEQRIARSKFTNLQHESNEDMSVDVQGLEGAKQEAIQEKESIEIQLVHVRGKRDMVNQQQYAFQLQLNEVRKSIEEFEERRTTCVNKVAAAVDVRMRAQNGKKHYQDKFQAEKKIVDDAEAAAEVVVEEFNNWSVKAADYCEQVPNPRKTEEVQRNLDSVLKALKEREKRFGASVEEMAEELNKAKDNLENAKKELKLMAVLKASLETRINRWGYFRAHKALLCKHIFQCNLSNRGYYGNIDFQHYEEKLVLSVETDDQLQTRRMMQTKKPDLLSGGEKSFTTICLLLSLWECIGCPLRCLDEFDVFMDAVNRRISMKMLIESAKMSDKKQYIFITPQDMTNVAVSSSVKVHRMSDPERRESR
ncbi:hypothetical protein HYPSUDRAFT_142094 [Hypholoma sublateritium FD-334 SS-4]|uniref:RecF/RecN/SMC N-terminal domain-containing protein n=1 Tax=Hypholoma sublateritium (strain FD-334 SS-4) TaxID=945553 RepID=A0A0D2L1H1_HYPSF|nr:hypothetical protein HYPSUDRAFT_142094 [Hypholoma sublateritium FD-334 SS-4]